jgi:hypothetical protein
LTQPELLALLKEHFWTRHHKVLLCAEDVAGYISSQYAPPAQRPSWEEASLIAIMGIDVVITPDSAPGSWRLVRHDHCAVIDVEDAEGRPDLEKTHVSHDGCTILGESR